MIMILICNKGRDEDSATYGRRSWVAGSKDMGVGLLARPVRFERTTFGFGGQHSIQLSYGRYGSPNGVAKHTSAGAVLHAVAAPAKAVDERML
jgi:hypothetical protein